MKDYLRNADHIRELAKKQKLQEEEAEKAKKRLNERRRKEAFQRYQEHLRAQFAPALAASNNGVAAGGSSSTSQSLRILSSGGFLGTTSTSQSDFYNGSTAFSISFWIKAVSATGTWVPYCRRRSGKGGIEAKVQLQKNSSTSGNFQMTFGDGFLGNTQITTLGNPDMTEWNHVVMTYNSVGPEFKIYLNANLSALTDPSGVPAGKTMSSTSTNVRIGRDDIQAGGGVGDPAFYDQVAIFKNTILTPANVISIYNETGGEGCPTNNNISSLNPDTLFEFDDATISSIPDTGANANGNYEINDTDKVEISTVTPC